MAWHGNVKRAAWAIYCGSIFIPLDSISLRFSLYHSSYPYSPTIYRQKGANTVQQAHTLSLLANGWYLCLEACIWKTSSIIHLGQIMRVLHLVGSALTRGLAVVESQLMAPLSSRSWAAASASIAGPSPSSRAFSSEGGSKGGSGET